jgi:hypothetical protein
MSAFTRRIVVLVIVLLLQAGCSGLKSCSSSAVSSGLVAVNWSQTCSATYDELTESQEVRISFEDLGAITGQVTAEIKLSVESGTVQLSMLDGSSFPVMVTASAGKPGEYSGTASVSSGPSARFDLTPLGGTARNVKYEVRFSG